MANKQTRLLPSALPPSGTELALWQRLSREEQIARYREVLEHPDSLRISGSTTSDVLAKARRRAAGRRES
ncbi:hypothetical protein [Bradyrhizobium sp. STM 3809]|uniref:hypothetical protein n=1 Tax=Bradyrhizobium sp. STM 3809 TaxID=551936 RepID=UPI0002408E6A|nr:hypothetical protein [Bradyrhizobium sp. STM 3809]CCE01134.1 conserved hypothetical protein [Bradyrhizobium sp. STM 3809]